MGLPNKAEADKLKLQLPKIQKLKKNHRLRVTVTVIMRRRIRQSITNKEQRNKLNTCLLTTRRRKMKDQRLINEEQKSKSSNQNQFLLTMKMTNRRKQPLRV